MSDEHLYVLGICKAGWFGNFGWFISMVDLLGLNVISCKDVELVFQIIFIVRNADFDNEKGCNNI